MKAVLVLDEMPKECDECPMYDFGWGEYCMATGKSVKAEGKESWCPLKEMPKKRGKMFLTERSQNDTDLMVKSAFANCYTDGWNECIEEIER